MVTDYVVRWRTEFLRELGAGWTGHRGNGEGTHVPRHCRADGAG